VSYHNIYINEIKDSAGSVLKAGKDALYIDINIVLDTQKLFCKDNSFFM